MALKPIVHDKTHTIHQSSEDIISQRIAFKPRVNIYGYKYILSNITKRQSVKDIRDGQLRRTTVPDNYSGQLLRITTPDNGAGQQRRTQGFSVPSPRASPTSGKLPTRPAPVTSSSKIAGLGRDSLMHYGGASSLCWSVAGALRPPILI